MVNHKKLFLLIFTFFLTNSTFASDAKGVRGFAGASTAGVEVQMGSMGVSADVIYDLEAGGLSAEVLRRRSTTRGQSAGAANSHFDTMLLIAKQLEVSNQATLARDRIAAHERHDAALESRAAGRQAFCFNCLNFVVGAGGLVVGIYALTQGQ
jgi:hypothetical protein